MASENNMVSSDNVAGILERALDAGQGLLRLTHLGTTELSASGATIAVAHR